MTSWRETDPAVATDGQAPLSLRHILGAPPAESWWRRHRGIIWSATGWLTSAAVVVSAGYLLWALMYRHAGDGDPFLGLPRPRATSTTAPEGARAHSAEVVKTVRPEPLSGAAEADGKAPGTTSGAAGIDGSGGRSGPDPGPGGGSDSPTTTAGGSGGTTTAGDDRSGGNRGPGGAPPISGSSTTTTRSIGSTSSSTSTTRASTSSSSSSTDDDDGGSGSGSGSGGGSGSGSGGSGKG